MWFFNESSLSSNTPSHKQLQPAQWCHFPHAGWDPSSSSFSNCVLCQPDNFGFRWIQLKSSGRTPFVNGLNALLQSLDGGCDVVDVCALHQLSVVSIQMLTKLATVDEFSQFYCVGDNTHITPPITPPNIPSDWMTLRTKGNVGGGWLPRSPSTLPQIANDIASGTS